MRSLSKELSSAVSAAKGAGSLLKKFFGSSKVLYHKSPGDFVTNADKASDVFIKRHLSSFGYGWVSEESPKVLGSDFYWIVDPLDGTINFQNKIPFCCVAIALAKGNEVLIGVVYDFIHDELFYAVNGQGAFLNGRRIRVSHVKSLKDGVLTGTFVSLSDVRAPKNVMHNVCRPLGSAELELAYVACGRASARVKLPPPKLRVWDYAAGTVLVREAGGVAVDSEGGDWSTRSDSHIAGNSVIVAKICSLIR